MKQIKLINGKELSSVDAHKSKAFAIGSKLKWGNMVWEVIGTPHICTSCYFHRDGRCYRSDMWLEKLGACVAFARPDNENVIFQLHRL